jgi:hypothetical protein
MGATDYSRGGQIGLLRRCKPPLPRCNKRTARLYLEVYSELGSLSPRQLTELIDVLCGRKKLVILMSLLMLLATLIVMAPNTYESSAKVGVNLRDDPASRPTLSPNQWDSQAPEDNSRSGFSVNNQMETVFRCGSTSKSISKARGKATLRCKQAIW